MVILAMFEGQREAKEMLQNTLLICPDFAWMTGDQAAEDTMVRRLTVLTIQSLLHILLLKYNILIHWMEYYCALKATETVVQNMTVMTQVGTTNILDVDNDVSLMEIHKISIRYLITYVTTIDTTKWGYLQ
jgi:hypothetical protein